MSERDIDAALIANLWTVHDDLVSALERIATVAETVAALPTCGEREVLQGIAKLARAAIAGVKL